MSYREPWIGVDLDGTLAFHDRSKPYDPMHIGEPLAPMVMRIKYWLQAGHKVKIFTARATTDGTPQGNLDKRRAIRVVQEYLLHKCGLPLLEVTNEKDYACVQIWDDIAVRMRHNTGEPENPLP